MMIGLIMVSVGYAVFYWGLHHMQDPRYSLWSLLGFGTLFTQLPAPPAGKPVEIKA